MADSVLPLIDCDYFLRRPANGCFRPDSCIEIPICGAEQNNDLRGLETVSNPCESAPPSEHGFWDSRLPASREKKTSALALRQRYEACICNKRTYPGR